MSQWASVEARWRGPHVTEDWIREAMPLGSEGPAGITLHTLDDGTVWYDGRLRDFDDHDSPAVLAWFLRNIDVTGCEWAELTIDVDSGPRYRYQWDGSHLTKLRGVLD